MASSTVTILDKTGLQNHGEKVQTSATEYRSAISDVERKIEIKYKGEEAAAIEAFVKKLNSIATALYEKYPAVIESYGSTVKKYVSLVEGIGFSGGIVKTKDTDISSIKEWLGVTKAKDFQDILGDLSVALKKTSEALELSPYSTTFHNGSEQAVNQIVRHLTDLGKRREVVHDSLIEALKAFIDSLQSIQQRVAAVKLKLDNATFIYSLPVTSALKMISNGTLTTDNMDLLLDAIQAPNDGKVVEALGSVTKYMDLGKVNPEKVSDAMMSVVYGELYKKMKLEPDSTGDELHHVEAFFQGLSTQDTKFAKLYLERLMKSGDNVAALTMIEALELLPDFPKDNADATALASYIEQLNDEDIKKQVQSFQKELQKQGLLSHIFESAFVLNVGRHSYKSPDGSVRGDISTSIRGLKVVNGGVTFHIEQTYRNSLLPGEASTTKKYNIDEYLTAKGSEIDQASKQLRDLEGARHEAVLSFLGDLSKSVAYLTPYGATASITMNVLGDIMKLAGVKARSDLTNYAKDLRDGISNSTHKVRYVAGADGVKAFGSFLEKLKKLEDEAKKSEIKQMAHLFDGASYSLKDDGKIVKSNYSSRFDLQAAMTMEDLNENGLRAYVYRRAYEKEGPAKAQEALRDFDSELKYNPKIYVSEEERKKMSDKERKELGRKEFITGHSEDPIGQIGLEQTWEAIVDVGRKYYIQNSPGKPLKGEQIMSELSEYFKNYVGEEK